MSYVELKNLIRNSSELRDKLYICTFLSCNSNKMKMAKVTIVKNILGKYIVTQWLDYEYGRYLTRKEFSDKDLAATHAWNVINEQV